MCFLVSANIIFGVFAGIQVNAEVGDVAGVALNTDIVAYINHYAIPSYAVNGQSVIVAEDLRNFGFDVEWNGTTRSLNITKNININTAYQMEFDKNAKLGSKFTDILETDVGVYANGVQITSYAMNGYTMIPIEELTMLGEVTWVSHERAIKLWVDGLQIRPQSRQLIYTTLYNADGKEVKVPSHDVAASLDMGLFYYPEYVDSAIAKIYTIADSRVADGGYEAGIEYLEGLYVRDFVGRDSGYEDYFKNAVTNKIRALCDAWSKEIKSPIGIISTKVGKSYGIKEAGIAVRNLTDKHLTRFDMMFYCYDPYNLPVKYYGYSNNNNSFKAWCDESFKPYEMKWIYWDLYGFDECTQIKNLKMVSAVFSDGTIWRK